MKKHISIFSFFFFILINCSAFANSTLTMTSYYPAPTASYSQIKLATNAISGTITSQAGCINNDQTTLFMNRSTRTICQCEGTNITADYCQMNCSGTAGIPWASCGTTAGYIHTGSVLVDTIGTLHVCLNNTYNTGTYQDTVYPQQCYNAFCSYSSPASSCSVDCRPGFTTVKSDNVQISDTLFFESYVCCT